MKTEHLPFVVRIVQNESDLALAVAIRHAAFARHVPDLAQTLTQPEALDRTAGFAVFLALSKSDGAPVGTARLQTNGPAPLLIENSVRLPDPYQGLVLAHVSRFGVASGAVGSSIKAMLFKAMLRYMQQNQVAHVLAAARRPIDRIYERFLFEDVFDGKPLIPMLHSKNIPHRVMSLNVARVEQISAQRKHPLHQYFFETHHPDLLI